MNADTVLPFVFKRRIGRLSFAIVLVVLLVLFAAWVSTMLERRGLGAGLLAVKAAFLLAVVYRLHDLGWSGWWVLAAGLPDGVMSAFMSAFLRAFWPPFFWFVGVVLFCLLRGQRGDNEWGSVPWPAKRATAAMPAS